MAIKSADSLPSSVVAAATDTDVPPIHYCRCGQGMCTVLMCTSEINPGRRYYQCPGAGRENCGYFIWCDELRKNDIRESPPPKFSSSIPICDCGAGVCTMMTVCNGRFTGRKCFVCPLEKGEGACDFFLWQDVLKSSEQALMVSKFLSSVGFTETNAASGPTTPAGFKIASGQGHSFHGETTLHARIQAADHFKNELIALLESSKPQEYMNMLKEAVCTFATLAIMQVDYRIFFDCIVGYIKTAEWVSDVEEIISSDGEILRGLEVEALKHMEELRMERNKAKVALEKAKARLRC
ncbi:hypothetical protein Ancab_039712 [Ancistrocladus abbreviatus]